MDFESAIDDMERDLRRLKIEFEQFFNGALKTPPDQSRGRLVTRLAETRSHYIKSPALRFRLTNFEASFNQLNVFWNRRLRAFEEGLTISGAPVRLPVEKSRRRSGRAAERPATGIEISQGASDAAVRTLYDEFSRHMDPGRTTDYDNFRSFVMRQVSNIRQSTGCEKVSFRIDSQDGKLKLKAKPV